ncbi:MAG: hypothetical protein HY887_00925 [Deltaproteobacteria bacterium]|nr:hypothetical protein [Deltaproteobacteria bacterium]
MTPERLRVKVPVKKDDAGYFESLKDKFAGLNGIAAVTVNPATSSVLFIHSSGYDSIAGFARDNGLFRIKDTRVSHAPVSARIAEAFGAVDRRIKGFTSGDFDMASVAVLALVGFGIYQLSVGNFIAPAWYVAFWYAFNIFLKGLPGALSAA